MPTTGKRGETYIDSNGLERYVANNRSVLANRLYQATYSVAKRKEILSHRVANREVKRVHSAKESRNGVKCIRMARARAKRKGLPHNITHAYMMGLWPSSGKDWTGHPMVWKGERDGKFAPRPESPTIDMIDPTKGYVEGNVEWLAGRTNLLKGGWSPDQMRAFLKHIEEMKNANDAQARTSLPGKNEVGESTIEGKQLLKNIQSVLRRGSNYEG